MSSDTNVALADTSPHFTGMGKHQKPKKKTGLGARIAKAREAAGLNQTDLGSALSLTRSAVSQWESELTEPSAAAHHG